MRVETIGLIRLIVGVVLMVLLNIWMHNRPEQPRVEVTLSR